VRRKRLGGPHTKWNVGVYDAARGLINLAKARTSEKNLKSPVARLKDLIISKEKKTSEESFERGGTLYTRVGIMTVSLVHTKRSKGNMPGLVGIRRCSLPDGGVSGKEGKPACLALKSRTGGHKGMQALHVNER